MNAARTLLLGFATAALLQARAQQDPLYSQYMFNTLAVNPGYAGSADIFTVMALSRHQWVGFTGAPATQTVLAHTPLPARSMAMGLSLLNDKVGPTRQTGGYVDFAYRIRTGKSSRLAFGLKGGANLYQADLASLSSVDPDQANVSIAGKALPNFGFGLYWHGPRFYAGLSAPKLLENDIDAVQAAGIVTAAERRHYFLVGGYVIDIDRSTRFRPSVMVRMVNGAPLSIDLNANFLFRDRIWLGGMYRVGNSFGLLGQYQVNDQFRIGYAFDLTTTSIGAYNGGTHEVMLNYDLRFFTGRTVSPRYF
ncbi:MAG: type IX secretion system membrane protein PorP/SprF [Flavobacteriales bacterium]|nr:MAG: type IX secretion system membrane protein PorP/SprF [Flavobacteriales bacterium]